MSVTTAYITANVQSVQTEPLSLYMPLFDSGIIHNTCTLLECSRSLKPKAAATLALYEVTLSTRCNVSY